MIKDRCRRQTDASDYRVVQKEAPCRLQQRKPSSRKKRTFSISRSLFLAFLAVFAGFITLFSQCLPFSISLFYNPLSLIAFLIITLPSLHSFPLSPSTVLFLSSRLLCSLLPLLAISRCTNNCSLEASPLFRRPATYRSPFHHLTYFLGDFFSFPLSNMSSTSPFSLLSLPRSQIPALFLFIFFVTQT